MSKVPPLAGVIGTFPLPNTTPTPEVGETVKASDVQMAAQGLLNQDATLEALKLSLAGGTMTGGLTLAGIANALILPNGGTIIARDGALATTIQLIAALANIAIGAGGVPSVVLDGITGSVSVSNVGPGHHGFFSPRTFTRVCRTRSKFSSPEWAESGPSAARHFYTQGVVANPPTDVHWMEFDVDLPNGCTVTELRWFIDPPAGHGGGLPSLPPRLQLVRQDLTTIVGYTISAEGADATGAGSYEAPHEMIVPALSVPITGEHQWIIRARGEHGTNAFVNLQGYTPRVVITMPYALEGG